MNTSNQRGREETFTVLGETFSARHFPRLLDMYRASPENLERQLRSIANAWHEGSVASAAAAFESDLQHG